MPESDTFNEIACCRYGRMIYNKFDLYIGKSLEVYGEFSELEVEFFRQAIHAGDTVLDVGANIGCHTVAFSRLVGEAGKVLAFEPQRINFFTLCGNIALNSLTNVEAANVAVGAAFGTIPLPLWNPHQPHNSGGYSLGEGAGSAQVITIDALELAACDFIKADVEGMEATVLCGARETIARFRPFLFCEDDRHDKRAELYALLKSFGYRLFSFRPPLYNPANYRGIAENLFPGIGSLNVIGVPRETPCALPFPELT